MGRIKTLLVKRATHKLIEKHGSEFTDDFGKNKEIVNKWISTPSKKLRNVIAGYVTRLVKVGRETKRARGPSSDNEPADRFQ